MKYSLSYTMITRVTGFLSRTIFYFRKTELDIMREMLKDKTNVRILDYGCNTGYFLDMIKNKYPNNNFDLCGSDINPYALEYARKKYSKFTFYNIDEEFFKKEKFDIIILSHVLEHVVERDVFIENLKKLLNENGELIIAVPQERVRGDCTIFQLLYNIIRLRFENPHVVRIFYNDLNVLLKNHGLEIKEYIYTNFFYPFRSNKKRFDAWSMVVKSKKCPLIK